MLQATLIISEEAVTVASTTNDSVTVSIVQGSSPPSANAVSFTPAGNVVATNVQSAIEELDTEKQATLVSATNIKTINGDSILGSGDLEVSLPPKSGTGTITTTGWVANTGDYAYKLDLTVSGIEVNDVIMVTVNTDDMDTAQTAQLCSTIDSYAGGITFYAKTVPTATIGFSYCSIVVTSQTGGDFTKGVCFYVDGTLYTDTKLMTVISPISMTVIGVRMSVDTAPTGADLIVDVNKNGTTMYTTQVNRPTITAGETTETATLPDVISIGVGDRISIDIDQVGSTVNGSNLAVTLICEV